MPAPNAVIHALAPILGLLALVLAVPVHAQDEAAPEAAQPETTVRVTGTPDAASVVVDRQPFGIVPFEGTLGAGLHYFVVSAPGYYAELRDVVVEPDAGPLELRFDLVLDPALQPRGANAPMIVGGSVVALGGVAGIVLAIVGATGDRRCSARCDEPGDRHVVERPAVDAIVTWSVAGGILLVVGAVLIGFGATAGGPARGSRAAGRGPELALRADGLAVVF